MTESITDEHNPHGSIKKLNEKIKNASVFVDQKKGTLDYYITSLSLEDIVESKQKPAVIYENIIIKDGIITGTDIHWKEKYPYEFSTITLDTRNGLLFRTVVLNFRFTKFFNCEKRLELER